MNEINPNDPVRVPFLSGDDAVEIHRGTIQVSLLFVITETAKSHLIGVLVWSPISKEWFAPETLSTQADALLSWALSLREAGKDAYSRGYDKGRESGQADAVNAERFRCHMIANDAWGEFAHKSPVAAEAITKIATRVIEGAK